MDILEADSESDVNDDEVNTFQAASGQERWTQMSMVMDSGSADPVMSAKVAPGIPIRSSAGSRRGQRYSAANGRKIENEGEQHLSLFTSDGLPAPMTVQIADVKRPLCSVARLCDRGNRVVFDARGGAVQNLRTGVVTKFRREGGIYMLDLWLDQKSEGRSPGFTRRG